MTFYDELHSRDWAEVEQSIYGRSEEDVARALANPALNMESLTTLLSPAAEGFIEEMAQRAHRLTGQRFGRVMSMFAPLYVSNVCTNSCVYCGFNVKNPVKRAVLTVDEAYEEAVSIRKMGFRHILLVAGEAPNVVPTAYFKELAQRLRPLFSSISIEIYPMPTEDYAELVASGVDGLVVFQETYSEAAYPEFHPAGKKSNFRWRLETPDRGGVAGFRRLGLGTLLGLCDWRVETFFMGLHAAYLQRRFWKSQVTISFPRLRPAAGAFQPRHEVSDRNFVQMLTALRLFLPDASLTLSTRETPALRDNLVPLGITSMSAGSHTEPGGYAKESAAEAQFEIADSRSPEEVAAMLRGLGYEPVWKDWDAAFLNP